MQLQRVFTEAYVESLKKNITPDNYLLEAFPYDPQKVRPLANVYAPVGLEEKLIKAMDNEFEQAIALYEAFETLTPLVASQQGFWTYLTHVDLYHFIQKRWPLNDEDLKTNEQKQSYILNHWFRSPNGVMRTSLANLWWSVYCSIDDQADKENRYELTKVLFSRSDYRTRRLGSSTLVRHKEAVIGILQFMKDHEDFMNDFFEGKSIYIAKYFNNLGGTKPLAYMDRNFFYDELVAHIEDMSKLHKREDILNK